MQKPLIAVLLASAFLTLDAHAVDLVQVYQQALANDATFASARAAVAAGREKTTQGRAGLLPTVAATGFNTKDDRDSAFYNVAPGGTNLRTNQYQISLTQPLFRWDRLESYEQGKLATAIAEAQFAQAREDLVTRVAQAYFDVLGAQDTLESTRAQKAAVAEQLASAKRNFEVGTQTITDTHEAQAAYDLTVAQELAAINDLDNKRNALQAIIGTVPGDLAKLKPGVTINAPQPLAIENWISSAENENPLVQVQQLTLESAKHEIRRQRAGHLPTLDLVANSTHQRVNGQLQGISGKSSDNAVGVQWSVPIFSGFAVNSRVRESIALEDKARNDLEATRRSAALQARQAYLGVNSGLAQVKALEAAEVSSQSALDSNKLGYQVGVRINIDVLNAQKQLYSTQTDLAKARYNTIMNGLRLKAAAGTLSEQDLAAVNGLLQN
ncbi:TolC family outer membrane protein [Massilia terrae]|uniref:TolC family outer membrane protein n=1 Tax=Massilia terrae TaxID=1811224 RepID=A0ABT2D2S8_9BURK|nr:TolC family outer membrane protein [Massilia terrae]MCS0660497.1 TolC family outer membrane protein [Massilia terrae]